MNCRTFQKNLEDYLENSLDFAGRFGMERHARQCIRCGRELADAQNLSRMVRGLDRVKAPQDFETAVLSEIGRRKLRSRFPMLRRFLVFGFGMPSWKHYAWAASAVIVLGLGFLYWQNSTGRDRRPSPSPARTAAGSVERPGAAGTGENRIPAGADTAAPEETIILATEGSAGAASRKEPLPGTRAHEPEYREYRAIGPDNLPLIIPLPDRFHMQITPPPEEYFIRNVSH